MDSFTLPPTMSDWAPEFCFCGRKSVESHEYWFCSTECARQDSLRSLDNPECHYRNVVRANVQAGAQPRRMVSADQLRRGPSEQYGFPNVSPPVVPRAALDRKMPGFPTLSQVTGKVLSRKAAAAGGEPLATGRHDRPRWQGLPNTLHARPVQRTGGHTFEQASFDAVPLPEHVPARPLRRIPSSVDGVRNDAKKPSVATLLNFDRSWKGKESGNPERTFGHPVNPIIPPVRNESLPLNRQMNPCSAIPAQSTKALRRSVSFSGWNATAHGVRGPLSEQDPLVHIIEEMREELSESFDPGSLFDQEEDY